MPTYEYRCERGHEFERFQKMSDEPLSTCPECGADAERIVSGGAGFVFKGEGFYATDYASDEYRKKKEKEKKAGASGDAGGAGEGGGGPAASDDGGGAPEPGGSPSGTADTGGGDGSAEASG